MKYILWALLSCIILCSQKLYANPKWEHLETGVNPLSIVYDNGLFYSIEYHSTSSSVGSKIVEFNAAKPSPIQSFTR